MWDIKGKALGVPVYELLGGPTRDRIRVYGQAESVEAARGVMAEGYTSMKTSVNNSRSRPSRYSEFPERCVEHDSVFPDDAKPFGTRFEVGTRASRMARVRVPTNRCRLGRPDTQLPG